MGQCLYHPALQVVGMFLFDQRSRTGDDGSAEACPPSGGVVIAGVGRDHSFAGSGKGGVGRAKIGKCASLIEVIGRTYSDHSFHTGGKYSSLLAIVPGS